MHKIEHKDYIVFLKQKTAYDIYQCDWSSDVCSSDLIGRQVVNSTVIRYGRTSRDRNRDSGYAASAAHATVSGVAPPHSPRLLSIGLNVIPSVHTAEKLSSVGLPGADPLNVASPSTEASTSQ